MVFVFASFQRVYTILRKQLRLIHRKNREFLKNRQFEIMRFILLYQDCALLFSVCTSFLCKKNCEENNLVPLYLCFSVDKKC